MQDEAGEDGKVLAVPVDKILAIPGGRNPKT